MTVASSSLGVPGYTFADLHDPERLASLYERFCEEVAGCRSCLLARVGRVPAGARCAAAAARAVEPAGRRWRRTSAGSSRGCSTSMRRRRRSREATRDQDDLFRFKVDFVRRRALPLLKGGAHVSRPTRRRRCGRRGADRRARRPATASSRSPAPGCALLDRGESRVPDPRSRVPPTREPEALVRGAPPRSAPTAAGSSSAFPRTSTTGISSRSSTPRRSCPRRWSAPTGGCAAATASS